MKKLVALLFITCWFATTSAQNVDPSTITGITVMKDMSKPAIWSWSQNSPTISDTALLTVHYNLNYLRDTVAKTRGRDLMVMQLGRVQRRYYNLRLELSDRIHTWLENNRTAPVPGASSKYEYSPEDRRIDSIAGDGMMNSEIWIDTRSRTLLERVHDYHKPNLAIVYEEPQAQMDWDIRSQTDTVCGYFCCRAVTHFRGREWSAWYTPEIPVDAGPWKFCGLPGLILRVEDTDGEYTWQCNGISQDAEPIAYYNVTEQRLPKKQWFRYMRMLHEAPLEALGEGGTHLFIVKGKQLAKEDNWTIPYNPIERE